MSKAGSSESALARMGCAGVFGTHKSSVASFHRYNMPPVCMVCMACLMNVPRQAPPDRKSIGAEVNYGVRFDTQTQADGFLSELAVELSRRMAAEGVLGRALTLKIMKQRDVSGVA